VSKILDLRQRGSETVSHSEGTGPGTFTTNKFSPNTQSSTFTAAQFSKMGGRFPSRPVTHRSNSNIVLRAFGGTQHSNADSFDDAIDHVDSGGDVQSFAEMDLEKLSAAIGGDNGEPLADEENNSPNLKGKSPQMPAAVHRGIPTRTHSDGTGVRGHGIRVDVEKATSAL
jgi:hypothetical protein